MLHTDAWKNGLFFFFGGGKQIHREHKATELNLMFACAFLLHENVAIKFTQIVCVCVEHLQQKWWVQKVKVKYLHGIHLQKSEA